MDLASLILSCAPFVSPDTMTTYIEQRSQADPLAIHITETDRWIRPKNQAEAVAAAKKLVEDGIGIEAGLAQIKSADWAKYELTPETVFDPCKNLAAAERDLVTAYGKPKRSSAKSKAGKQTITGLVRTLAPKYSLDPKLVLAVIEAESNFNPKARSPENAQGLMQLIPATAARFGVRDVWDPEQNLRGGMAYLQWLLKHFKGDVKLALAGYNAGEKAVERHGGIPPYAETQAYVKRIMKCVGHTPTRWVQKEEEEGRAGGEEQASALLFDVGYFCTTPRKGIFQKLRGAIKTTQRIEIYKLLQNISSLINHTAKEAESESLCVFGFQKRAFSQDFAYLLQNKLLALS